MTQKKSVLFICEANKDIGFGHLSRSLEIFLCFRESSKYNLFFLPVVRRDILIEVLDARKIKMTNEILNFEGWDYKILIKLLIKKNIDLVFFDTFLEHYRLRDFVSQQGCKSISLDYFFEKNIPDVTINLINHPKFLSLLKKTKKRKIFSGGKYAVIRKEFEELKILREIKKSKISIESILVVLGGADPGNKTMDAISIISQNLDINKIKKIDIVVGYLFSDLLKRKLSSTMQSFSSKINIYDSPKNFAKLFEDKDIVFCGGGTTLLETMSLGIPAIVLPQSDEEMYHAKYYEDKGCCVVANKNIIPFQIKNSEFRFKLSINAIKAIDFLGKFRIIKIADNLLNEKK